MNKIDLNRLGLKTFTEQDVLDYCQINNIDFDNIIYLELSSNELTDISGLKLFKNFKILYLGYNKITDLSDISSLKKLKLLYLNNTDIKNISVILDFKDLEILNINNLELESDQIQYIKSLKKLLTLYCYNGFKDMNTVKQFNNIKIIK